MEPFLHNHQYNRIAQQAKLVLSAYQTSTDRKVLEAARASALTKSIEACPGADGEQLALIERIAGLKNSEELQAYLHELSGCTLHFPSVTESQLRGLFPKVKRLRMPAPAILEEKPRTYLGWMDPGTNRLYLVYSRLAVSVTGGAAAYLGQLAGIEGQFQAVARKGVCAFCNRSGDTILFTVTSKKRLAHLPDYYKAVGQYICMDSETCNSRITEIGPLEQFFESAAT